MKITVAQYILDYLSEKGIQHVFGITGGAIAFVIDEFHGRKDIEYVPVMHEQAAAMAADAYARVHKSGMGATMVTSGPGATNLLTGIACSYFDSIPTIHITGQVNTFDQGQRVGVRQIGFQETNIVDMAAPITKAAVMLNRADGIKSTLDWLFYMANEGRKGPVLLDIPQNLQRELVDPKKLQGYTGFNVRFPLEDKIDKVKSLLVKAKRPLVLVGNGARGSEEKVKTFLELNTLPYVTSWSASDMLKDHDHFKVGKIGVYGDRGANFALQDCDLLISLGSRLDTRQVGSKQDKFAPKAKKVVVDLDESEFIKLKKMKVDVEIVSSVKQFLDEYPTSTILFSDRDWIKKCTDWTYSHPMVQPKYHKQKKTVNAYVFNEALSDLLPDDACIIPDDGGNLVWTMQAFKVKSGQRLFSAFGNSPMGYSFPASMGVAVATKKPVICIDGDGSFQINIQELQTVVSRNLPVKIFIMDNNGYGIIKQFQNTHLEGRHQATGVATGVTRPDFIKIAKAYGLKTVTINNHKDLRKGIQKTLRMKGPVLCRVVIDELQPLIPKLDYGDTLDNMSPKL